MMDYHELAAMSSYKDSLKIIEADIQHANLLAASIPRAKSGSCLQMKLVSNHLAPVFLFLFQWMDCSCTSVFRYAQTGSRRSLHADGKQLLGNSMIYPLKSDRLKIAAVILPSLQRLHGDTVEPDATQEEGHRLEMIVKNRLEDRRKLSDVDLLREDECGICLEPCTKMVAPSCCHAMCINCYHEWNTRSESCPFCRGSLKRVNSEDLWVLTCIGDVVDTKTVLKEDILRFYLFINNLPKDIPDDIFLMYYEHLI
uniref:RING-type domain-containing protein n=1 Tax=Salix viminalis TaxID=40686 RepID=A0A6N2MEZ1_SALVM